ncbi:MAG: type I-E CRISPR-associated protein Cse1/CasA [Planctomycetaceae bacterium]
MDKQTFNLIEKPFIPCVIANGERVEFGLLETLARAHEIRELRDESPLVTIALHRLLLAILHRNFGPDSYDSWKTLWDAGKFDTRKLSDYFEAWYTRFDLFDDQHPFYQDASLQADKVDAAARLVRHVAQTFTDSLFNHTIQNSFPLLSFAEVARHLIVEQSLAMSGGAGYVSSHQSYSMLFLATGNSLFETLMLNLVWYDPTHPIPSRKDLPTWEQDSVATNNRAPRGYLESLTWQPRRIRLIPEENGVREIVYIKGPRCEHVALRPDPMLAYRASKQSGVYPYSFSPERALWRDSSALFLATTTDSSPEFFRPDILTHLMNLSMPGREYLDSNRELDLKAFGILGKNAAIEFWRAESLPLPLAFLSSSELVGHLQNALSYAEAAGRFLFGCSKSFATQLLAPDGRKPDATRVTTIARSLAPDRPYWSRLELPFRELLHELADQPDDRELLVAKWGWQTVRMMAIQAFEETTQQLDHSARTLRAATVAMAQLRGQLHKQFSNLKEFIDDNEKLHITTAVAD